MKASPKTRIVRFLMKHPNKEFKTVEIAKKLRIEKKYMNNYMKRIRGWFGIKYRKVLKDNIYWCEPKKNK